MKNLMKMKTVDNFEQFKSILHFDSEDEFYFLQILVRGKDGHTEPGINGNNKNRLIKMYTVKSLEHFIRIESEIKAICNAVNARAYIHPTKRSFKEVSEEMFRTFTETFLSQNHIGMKGCYSTACGKSYIKSDKKWVIDLDDEWASIENINKICNFIEDNCKPIDVLKLQYIVETVHGKHLITKPFDSLNFSLKFPEITIQKNNPTLLYYNDIKNTL